MIRVSQKRDISQASVYIGALSFLLIISLILLSGCTQPQTKPDPAHNTVTVVDPASYEEIYDAIEEIHTSYEEGLDNFYYGGGIEESESGSDMSTALSTNAGASGDYSQTNVQVEGIDEGDIVKNDGEFIYLISNSEIVIVRAEGDNTAEVSRIKINAETLNKMSLGSYDLYPTELYVDGDKLLVIYSYSPEDEITLDSSSTSEDASSSYLYSPYSTVTEVACFDITDKEDPRYLASFGQDGSFSSSRLQDGTLYLVSNHSILFSNEITRDKPETYIPLSYTDDQATTIPATDILVLPDSKTISYSVVCSLDVGNVKRIDTASVLGSNDTLYMSPDNLYLSGQVYDFIELDSYKDGSFTVTEYENGYHTNLVKLALDTGTIDFVAETQVSGHLLDQFSLDEFDGYLRLVTTVDTTNYRTLDDGKGEVYDYNYTNTNTRTNALYILDDKLEQTGSIEGLAEDERVYSVRFSGDVGYFVTFRQVDPLFTVDLSDPSNPTIKSALKIPGFSNYLHPYSENRLFGLGMAANSQGRTSGLKLSMFDTSNAYDVTEKHMLALDASYSEAQYDHKAILIDPGHDFIGFPASGSYHVYGYSDENGFFLRKDLEGSGSSYYSAQRGLYIDDYLYVCATNNIGIYTLDSLNEVKQVSLSTDEPNYEIVRPFSATEESS